jgi:hypothetical protein
MSKNSSLQVSNPKDEKISVVTTLIVMVIISLLWLIPIGGNIDVKIADPVVETQTYLDEIILEPSSSGGSSSSSDASPSMKEGQVITNGDRYSAVKTDGNPNGKGSGDSPFGGEGSGGSGSGGFGPATGPEGIGEGDGTICDNTPTNLNTITNLLKNNVSVSKPKSCKVTIKIKANGSVSSVTVEGLNASESVTKEQIKSIVAQTKCTPCNGINRNERTYTFDKIQLKQD